MDVIHDTKDIFVEAFDITNVNDNQTIIEKLVHIVDKVNIEDIKAKKNLMDWSSRKYHTKVLTKISNEIELGKIDLATKVIGVKTLLKNINMMFIKLCDASLFIEETQNNIMRLPTNIKASRTTMETTKGDTSLYY